MRYTWQPLEILFSLVFFYPLSIILNVAFNDFFLFLLIVEEVTTHYYIWLRK